MKTIGRILLAVGFVFLFLYNGCWFYCTKDENNISAPTSWMIDIAQHSQKVFGSIWISFLYAPILIFIGAIAYYIGTIQRKKLVY